MGGTREVLRGGVLLGPNGLVCFQGGRDVLPLAAEKGQPGGLVGELYDNGHRRRWRLARDGLLAGEDANPVGLGDGVRELREDVNQLAGLGGDQDRFNHTVVDPLGKGLGVAVVLGGVAESVEPDRAGP